MQRFSPHTRAARAAISAANAGILLRGRREPGYARLLTGADRTRAQAYREMVKANLAKGN